MRTRPVSELIRGQNLLALPPETTIRHASERMLDRRVGCVVVTDAERRLLGIFTERDALYRVLAKGLDAETTTLGQVMTTRVSTIAPKAMAIEALRMMHDGGFRHVPIVADGVVLGVVSRSDFKGEERTRLEEETSMFEAVR